MLTLSPDTWVTVCCRRIARSATSVVSVGGSPVSVSLKNPLVTVSGGSSNSGVGRLSERLPTITRASVRSRSARPATSSAAGAWSSFCQADSNSGRAVSTPPSRLSVLCVRSCERSGLRRTTAATTSVSALVTTKAARSRPRSPRGISRRISEPSLRLPEAVSAAGDREDQRGLLGPGLELLPQVADVDVDRAGVPVRAVAPDGAQELLPVERVAGAAHQPRQELVL